MKTKIIYIMGTGRSGTTLLDIILGNATDILSAGELNRYTKRNGIPHSARDKQVEDFWSGVSLNFQQAGYDEPLSFFNKFNKFEYHKRALILLKNLHDSPKFIIYSDFQKLLFESLHNRSQKEFGKTTIIDSSKYPLRGYCLSKIFKDEISFIYIKRSPNEVVHSFQKRGLEQPAKKRFSAHLYLLWVNLLSIVVIKILRPRHKTTTVVFDNLLSSPLETLLQIEKDLEVDLSIPKKIIETNSHFVVGPLFDGNRLRSEKAIFLARRKPEKPRGTLFDRLVFPLHKVFWYGKQNPVTVNNRNV